MRQTGGSRASYVILRPVAFLLSIRLSQRRRQSHSLTAKERKGQHWWWEALVIICSLSPIPTSGDCLIVLDPQPTSEPSIPFVFVLQSWPFRVAQSDRDKARRLRWKLSAHFFVTGFSNIDSPAMLKGLYLCLLDCYRTFPSVQG